MEQVGYPGFDPIPLSKDRAQLIDQILRCQLFWRGFQHVEHMFDTLHKAPDRFHTPVAHSENIFPE
jgi:hypothetical protein